MGFLYFVLLIAAAMTVLGGMIFIKLNHHYPASIQILTGLSGGFLLSLIFIGIIPEAREMLEQAIPAQAPWTLPLAVAMGALVIIISEKIVPVEHHHDLEARGAVQYTKPHLFYVVLVAFGIHSLFEFISVLIAGQANLSMGLMLAVVIAVHNIPIGFVIMVQLEGIGASEKRIMKGLIVLAASETILAIGIFLLLHAFINTAVQGVLLGATAGVMLYLLFDELLPQIYKDADQHQTNFSIIIGALAMLLFLNVFGG